MGERLRTLSRVRPWSAGAFAVGLFAVVTATAIQTVLFQFGIELWFAVFLPAVFLAALFAGLPAGVLVVVITVPLVWWAFIPPVLEFSSLRPVDITAITAFLFSSLFLIFLADGCRAAVALLSGRAASEERQGG
jgi:K+-sensing histidine kinase KdpD